MILLALAFGFVSYQESLTAAPPTRYGWTMIWNDEFNGNSIDGSKWDAGGLPWGGVYHKSEYASAITPQDSYLDGSGHLVLTCRYGSFPTYKTPATVPWSEGMIHSYQDEWFCYGYVEINAVHPNYHGTWPAFWMLANGWPPEIDVSEYFGSSWPNQMHAGLAYGPSYNQVTWNDTYYSGSFWSWHTYGLNWFPGGAQFYSDQSVEHSIYNSNVPSIPMYMILNSGMRWDWDSGTPLTNSYMVDYVRIYKRSEYLYNPGFENNNGPWDVRNGAGYATDFPHWGSAAMRLQGSSNVAAEQTAYGLLPNTDYLFGGWACAPSNSPAVYLGVKNFGNAETSKQISTATYSSFLVPFSTGQTNTTALFYAWCPAAANPVYVDDVILRRVATITDPGFETADLWVGGYNLSGQGFYGSSSIVGSNARSGDYCLKLASNTWSGYEQVVYGLKPNTTYVFSGWAKNSGVGGYLGVKSYTTGSTQVYTNIQSTSYAKAVLQFTTGPANSNATVYAWGGNYLTNDMYFDDLFLSEPLAAPWQRADIGTGIPTGDSGLRGANFVVRGAGTTWGTADAFHFVYRPMTNSGQIVAHICSLDNQFYRAKVGLMLRESLSSGSKHASLFWTPYANDGQPSVVESLCRASTSGASTSVFYNNMPIPPWLRIVRQSNTFTAFASQDGVNWLLVQSNSITMGQTIYAGMLAYANATNDMSEGVLNNVAVLGVDSNGNGIPDDWELTNFGNLNTATATSDYDGDGFTDLQEWQCGLNPKSRNALVISKASPIGSGQMQIQFYGAPGMAYPVETSSNLIVWATANTVARTTNPAQKQGGLILHQYQFPVSADQTTFARVRLK